MSMSRRHFLLGSAAIGSTWLAGPLAGCANTPPKISALSPGASRVHLGAATVTMLSDGFVSRPLDANFVRNAPLSSVQATLAAAGLPTDRIDVPFTPMVVDIGNQRILFDAGNGEFGAATAGKMFENMGKAGIQPASITAVVLSHFHGDHINGLRNKAGTLVFANARIFAPKPEWEWWMDDTRMFSAPEGMKPAFNATRRVFSPIAASVVKFEPGTTILPGVQSMPAYGHTPGHTVFTIDGGSRKLLYWADTTNVAALFVRNPDWAVMFDMDAEKARSTRRKLAESVIQEQMLLAGYHLPGAAIGTLNIREQGYEFSSLS